MSVGVDIEDISRFVDKSQAFLNRIYTETEQIYCASKVKSERHYAVRFCAKEAITKALNSLGIAQPDFREIEIYNNEKGCPFVRLPRGYENLQVDISLSHDKTKAIAFVVINKK